MRSSSKSVAPARRTHARHPLLAGAALALTATLAPLALPAPAGAELVGSEGGSAALIDVIGPLDPLEGIEGQWPGLVTNALAHRLVGTTLSAEQASQLTWLVANEVLTEGDLAMWLVSLTDATRGAIARTYLVALGRWPSSPELLQAEHWLRLGASVQQLTTALAATPEYAARFEQGNNTSFTNGLYRATLNRAPSAGEATAIAGALQQGVPRSAVVAMVAASPEYATRVRPFVEYEVLHLGLWRQSPTEQQRSAWLQGRAGGATSAQLATAMIVNPEFVPIVLWG